VMTDKLYPVQRKPKRSAVAIEEDRTWIRFYRQAGNADIAAEVLNQLDADIQARHEHLALYLRCRESLRAHKARTQRNKRIGQFVRLGCRVIVAEPLRALRWGVAHAIDLLVECLPKARREPAAGKVRKLRRDAAIEQAHASFAATTGDAGPADSALPAPGVARTG
jgi:hypothetical protein